MEDVWKSVCVGGICCLVGRNDLERSWHRDFGTCDPIADIWHWNFPHQWILGPGKVIRRESQLKVKIILFRGQYSTAMITIREGVLKVITFIWVELLRYDGLGDKWGIYKYRKQSHHGLCSMSVLLHKWDYIYANVSEWWIGLLLLALFLHVFHVIVFSVCFCA